MQFTTQELNEHLRLSKHLRRYATLLTLEKRNFNLAAYCRSASQTLESFDGSLQNLMADGLKNTFPDAGPTALNVLNELLTTGQIREAVDLQAQHPTFLCDLLELPGIGIQLAQRIFYELHIESPADLHFAIKNGKLSEVPGYGEKKESVLTAYTTEKLLENPKLDFEPAPGSQAPQSDSKSSPKINDAKALPKISDAKATPKINDAKATPKASDAKSSPKASDTKASPQVSEPRTTHPSPAPKAHTTASKSAEPHTEKPKLFCPKCYQASVHYPTPLEDDTLLCSACSQHYPIDNDILLLQNTQDTSHIFSKQLQYLRPALTKIQTILLPHTLLATIEEHAAVHTCTAPSQILYFGAGLPALCEKLASNKNCDTYCLNNNQAQLLSLRKALPQALPPQMHLLCANFERIPFPDAYFDRIVWDPIHMAQHFSTQTLSELLRVLKTHATLIITGLNLPSRIPRPLHKLLQKAPIFNCASPQLQSLLHDYDLHIIQRQACAYLEVIALSKDEHN